MHAAVLRYVDAVAKFGSIRKASEQLNVSASAINRQVLLLEEDLGAQLFERRASGMKPTQIGIIVLEHVRRTLHEYEVVKGEIAYHKAHLTGRVRIATLDSLTVHILPKAMMEFRRRYPGVTFRIETADPSGVSRLVANDSADIGLTFERRTETGFTVVHAMPAAMCAIMHHKHRLADASEISVFDCPAEEVILQEDTGPIGDFLGKDLARAKNQAQPVLVSDTIIASKAMIIAGAGIGFFTRFGFLNEIADGTIVAVPLIEEGPASLTLTTIISAGRRQTSAVETFLDHLRGVLDEEKLLAVADP